MGNDKEYSFKTMIESFSISGSENINTWMIFIKNPANKGRVRLAVRRVFETILWLEQYNKLEIIDNILSSVIPSEFPIEVTLSFLAITRTSQSLPSRTKLFELTEEYLHTIRTPENVSDLLAGLK